MLQRCLFVVALLLLLTTAAFARQGVVTTSDNVKLHYIEEGKGPAILFIPGWTMPGEIWRPQIDALSKKFRVVALDPRGHGSSDSPTDGYYPARRVQDLHEVITQLKLAPVLLVGWSLGVPEVLTYVDTYGTATLSGIGLVDGRLGGEDPQMLRAIYGMLQAMQKDRAGFTRAFVKSMYKQPQKPEYLEWVAQSALKVPTTTAFTMVGNYFIVGDWRPVLKKVDKPLLFVYSTPQLKKDADEVMKSVPPAKVEIFEQSGHALFVDEPEKFNALIERMLQVEAAAPAAPRK